MRKRHHFIKGDLDWLCELWNEMKKQFKILKLFNENMMKLLMKNYKIER